MCCMLSTTRQSEYSINAHYADISAITIGTISICRDMHVLLKLIRLPVITIIKPSRMTL